MKTALITGITGQDGSYLAEFLLDKGYEVHGVVRRTSSLNTWRIDHILPDISLYYGDMTDTSSIASIIKDVYPDEIYNLAAQSQVRTSFICPDSTGDITGLGVTRILESARTIVPHAKYTRPPHLKCSGRLRLLRTNALRSTRKARMHVQNSTHITW